MMLNAPDEEERGVMEDPTHRDDERQFTLKTRSTGKWLGTFLYPADIVDGSLIQELHEFLSRYERSTLRII